MTATRSGDAPARGKRKSTEPKALPKLLRRAQTPPGPGSPHRPRRPGRGLRPAGMAVSIQTGCAALDFALGNGMGFRIKPPQSGLADDVKKLDSVCEVPASQTKK